MARKDGLLAVYANLQQRKVELLRTLTGDLKDLRREVIGKDVYDDAEAASESLNSELSSQLAQFESRELTQIDRAMYHLRNGSYGQCEKCTGKIPVARLNALPYSTLCIDCQREVELDPSLLDSLELSWREKLAAERETLTKAKIASGTPRKPMSMPKPALRSSAKTVAVKSAARTTVAPVKRAVRPALKLKVKTPVKANGKASKLSAKTIRVKVSGLRSKSKARV